MVFRVVRSGNVAAVNFNGTYYYYVRNGQGDIVKLIDGNNASVVEYSYDSWGKNLAVTGSLATTLGAQNPFRYRGYVYDTETGLYYLQSRYYDPEVGRFINADILVSTGQGVLGHNMYSYCANNPVVRIDDEGEIFNTIFGAIAGGFISAWTRESDKESFGQAFARGAVSGAIAGFALDVSIATAGTGVAVLIAVGGGAIGGGIDHWMEQKHLGKDITAEGVILSMTIGGAMNTLFMGAGREAGRFVGKTVGEVAKAVKKNALKSISNRSMTKIVGEKVVKTVATNSAYAGIQSFFGVMFNKAIQRTSTLR